MTEQPGAPDSHHETGNPQEPLNKEQLAPATRALAIMLAEYRIAEGTHYVIPSQRPPSASS